ncbi:MAG: thioredoxin domain-containing protein [Candidatus Velthaea sp.]
MNSLDAAADFRFSPRPNNAHRIHWRAWDAAAFAEARAAGKPVLLSISAVWCHWCHVMDETTYSDERVTAAINNEYVPVRVDNDRRPDVNARYNMGGWPTTAVLTPDGDAITGATYLPPDGMLRFLADVRDFFSAHRGDIEQKTAEMRAAAKNGPPEAASLEATIVEEVVGAIAAGYDDTHGGFGTEPKFPQTDALELLLREVRVARAHGEDRPDVYDMLAKTALGMARGGMYDHVEGGFFRYSTTRDWSVPHFEKMAEDHGGFLRVYAGLYRMSRNDAFRQTLLSATRYVRTVLRDPATGLFAGSQDADEEYFALPLEERRQRAAPFVDRTAYVNWSANLIAGLFAAADVLGDDELAESAARALDAIVARALVDDDGLVRHYIASDGSAHVRGLLADQTWLLRALLDAYERDGRRQRLDRAVALADAVLHAFTAASGAFVDNAYAAHGIGRTRIVDEPLGDNGHAADALLRLAALTGDDRYAQAARRALERFAGSYARAGSFAAPYAAAVRRALEPPTVVRLVGDEAALADFRADARMLPDPLVSVRVLAAGEAEAAGFPPDARRAYVCVGRTCSAPVAEPAGLRDAYMLLR